MIELWINPYAIAWYIVAKDIGSHEQMNLLNNIYENEIEFIQPKYKGNQKEFFAQVRYWVDYLIDKENFDRDFSAVAKDFQSYGRDFSAEEYSRDFKDIDLFFMLLRIRIRYESKQGYVRIKLRRLLNYYGYKRRSPRLVSHLKKCLRFYHIQTYLKNGQACDIGTVDLDKMIMFRII